MYKGFIHYRVKLQRKTPVVKLHLNMIKSIYDKWYVTKCLTTIFLKGEIRGTSQEESIEELIFIKN